MPLTIGPFTKTLIAFAQLLFEGGGGGGGEKFSFAKHETEIKLNKRKQQLNIIDRKLSILKIKSSKKNKTFILKSIKFFSRFNPLKIKASKCFKICLQFMIYT
ncbi:hypothetical protein LBMAG27_15170 [Bacteroidota bacterium]|nr:hypothetical protein LBMAG27_15170 [Bacteroidota bacterium]